MFPFNPFSSVNRSSLLLFFTVVLHEHGPCLRESVLCLAKLLLLLLLLLGSCTYMGQQQQQRKSLSLAAIATLVSFLFAYSSYRSRLTD